MLPVNFGSHFTRNDENDRFSSENVRSVGVDSKIEFVAEFET